MGVSNTPATQGLFYTSTNGGTQTLGQDAAYWPVTDENPYSVIYSQYRFHWWVDANNDTLYPTEKKSKIWFIINPVTWTGTAGYNYNRGCRSDSVLNITYNGVTENKWPWKSDTCKGYSGESGPTTAGNSGRYWYYMYTKTRYNGPEWYKSYIILDHNKGNQFTVNFNINEGGAFKQNSSWTFTVTEPIRDHVVYVRKSNEWKKGIPYIYHNGAWVQNKEIYVRTGNTWTATKEIKD